MKYVPDTYTLKARISPVLLVALPLTLTALCWRADDLAKWETIWSLIIASGGGMFLAQLGRTRGKLLEPELFEKWGGKPTTVKLRIKESENPELVKKYHKYIGQIISDITLPTEKDEKNNPAKSDYIYDSIARTLIAKTRDTKKFPLIFKENSDYGFRRNLWGLKVCGLPISMLATLMTGGLIINDFLKNHLLDSLMTMCLLGNITLCLAWLFIIKPSWIKTVADAYAERLLESTENMIG